MPINVLVADDSVTMRKIMEFTLAGEDAKVTCVDSGDACIAKAAQLRPDVIYADVTMATDGYAVAHAIRNTGGLENTAIVVMASQKHPYDEARGRVAGVDAHIVKPFDTQSVIDQFRNLRSQPRAVASPGAAAAAAMPAPTPPRMPKTQTIAFGKVPLPMPPMMQPQAAPAPQSPQPAPQRTSVGHARLPAAPLQPLAPMQAPMQPMQRASVAHAPLASPPAAAPAPRSQPYSMGGASPGRASTVGAATHAATSDLASKLDGLGLTADQVEGVLSLSRDVIERVVWEVVPDLAETIIREELKRLTQ